MARRLRDDLLRRLLLPMASILLVSGLFSYGLAIDFVDRSYDRALLDDARSLSHLVGAGVTATPLALPPAALKMLEPGGGDRAFFLIKSRAHGVIAGDPAMPLPSDDVSAEPVFFNDRVHDENMRIVAMSIPAWFPGDTAVVLVGETLRRQRSLVKDIVIWVVVPQLALIFFSVLVIVGGVASGLKPLKGLAQSLERRHKDDLAPLSPAAVPGEAIPLIDAFNVLLTRLGEMLDVQRRFVADAAHQLRTPLAALKIQLEQALREPDDARRQELLEQLKASVDRTARLSSQLLSLARAEHGGDIPARQPVDLRLLALEVGGHWVPRALQCGRDLGFSSGEAPVWVLGDPTLLGEIISNLLDNALRYGGANVTLCIAVGSSGPELVVEDDGPGISEPERARVFERFHRVPGSSGEGSGLGLAIVREIVSIHEGSVFLESPVKGGLRVVMRFPAFVSG